MPACQAGRQQRRIEAWKYTSLRAARGSQISSAAPSPRHEAETILAGLPMLDAPRIVFVDGAIARRSVGHAPAGFARFAEQPDFGTLTWPDREPMVALNTMLAEDGAALRCALGPRRRRRATGQHLRRRRGFSSAPQHPSGQGPALTVGGDFGRAGHLSAQHRGRDPRRRGRASDPYPAAGRGAHAPSMSPPPTPMSKPAAPMTASP